MTELHVSPLTLATRMDAEQVVLEGRLPDGTVTVRGIARYRTSTDPGAADSPEAAE